MTGTPAANTGRCANAALNATLAQALMEPQTQKNSGGYGQRSRLGESHKGEKQAKKDNKGHSSTALCSGLDLDQPFSLRQGAH
jgi:hypothetical protein